MAHKIISRKGHQDIRSTQVYIHADLKLKEQALARTSPTTTKTGRYRPPDKLLAFLEGLGLCRSPDMRERGRQGFPGGRRHNRGPGIRSIRDIYLTGVDLRSTLQNPQVRPGSSPPRPTLAARR